MANVSLKLKMKDGSDYEITPLNGLNSVESKSQSTTQPKEIFYGVVPNTGSFEVTDYNGKIRKKIEADEIDYSNTQAELDFNGQVINSHITTDSDYNEDTVLSAEMTDTLANWDNINFAGRALTESCSLYVVLSDIVKSNLYQVYQRKISIQVNSFITDGTPFLKSSKRIFWSIETGELRENENLRLQVRLRKLPFTTKEIALTKESNPNNTDYPYRWVAITNEEFGDVVFTVYYDSMATDHHIMHIRINVLLLDNLTTTDSTSEVFNNFFPLDNYLAKNVLASRICVLNGASTREMTVAEYLKGITVQYPYLPASTLREAMTSVCEVAQLQIVGTHDNLWKFVSARPLMVATDAVLKIPPSMQFDRPQKDVILKNKYDGVELEAIDVKVETGIGEVVYTAKETVSSKNRTSNTDNAHYGYGTDIAYAEIYSEYQTFKVSFPKKTNLNLVDITEVEDRLDNNGNANIQYRVTYKTTQGVYGIPTGEDDTVESNLQPIESSLEDKGTVIGEIPKSISITHFFPPSSESIGITHTTTATLTDKSTNTTAKISQTSTTYDIELSLLVYSEQKTYYETTPNAIPIKTYYKSGDYYKYDGLQVKISFKGTKHTISFDLTKSASSANVASAKTVAKLNHNTLLQTGTTYKGTPIADIIRENVLADYKSGISTATLNCTCDDVYSTKGTLALNFSEGGTLRVGNIVRLDKSHSGVSYYTKQDGSPQHFKVTGVTYGYDGYPYQNLELQALSNDVTHIYATKVDDHYEVGDGTNFALTTYDSIIPKEININDFIGGKVTKVNAKAFFNDNTYGYPTLDLLVFDSEIVLDGYSLTNIANKIVFNGNVTNTTSDLPAIVFMAGQPFFGETPSTPIVEFGENVNIVGSSDGFLFGGAVLIGSGIQNEGILVFKNTGTITLNIRKANNIAVKLTIYADSSSVTTYDWASKNITATIKPLSEYKE